MMKKIFTRRGGSFIGNNFALARRKRVKAGYWGAMRKTVRRESHILYFAA